MNLRTAASPKPKPLFDRTITYGHILTVISFIIAGTAHAKARKQECDADDKSQAGRFIASRPPCRLHLTDFAIVPRLVLWACGLSRLATGNGANVAGCVARCIAGAITEAGHE